MRMEDLPLDDKDKRLGVQFAVGCGCFGELESVTSSVIGLKNVTMFKTIMKSSTTSSSSR